MPDSLPTEIVIVRRSPAWEDEEGAHGVWKIAYADFMTAMMAFFLVMWLINVTDDSIKSGVAQYFNPVKLASTAPNKKGLNDPNVVGDTNQDGANQPEGDLNAGMGRKDGLDVKKGLAPEQSDRRSEETPGEFSPAFAETVLFSDPYAVLDQLAAMAVPDQDDAGQNKAEGIGSGREKEAGAQGGEAFRDPFDPLYWQFLPTRGAGEVNITADMDAEPQSEVTVLEDRSPDKEVLEPAQDPAAADTQIVAHLTGDKPSQRSTQADKRTAGLVGVANALPAEPAAEEQLDKLIERLSSTLAENTGTALDQTASRVDITRTSEGVLISLTDDQNFGMFAIGSAEPRPELVTLLARLGKVIADEPAKIVIKGHTDARPFKSKAYDNWRLSSARAQMALYMLARGGVPMERFEKVEGYADRDLKNAKEPFAASNRRIEIFLRGEG